MLQISCNIQYIHIFNIYIKALFGQFKNINQLLSSQVILLRIQNNGKECQESWLVIKMNELSLEFGYEKERKTKK